MNPRATEVAAQRDFGAPIGSEFYGTEVGQSADIGSVALTLARVGRHLPLVRSLKMLVASDQHRMLATLSARPALEQSL